MKKITRYGALSQREGADDENNTDQNVLDWGTGSSALNADLAENMDSFFLNALKFIEWNYQTGG
jgi:hypothetical protein